MVLKIDFQCVCICITCSVWCLVFNTTFHNISIISWRSYFCGGNRSTQKKTTDLSQVTDKLEHMLYQVHLAMSGIRTHNYHTFTTTTTPVLIIIELIVWIAMNHYIYHFKGIYIIHYTFIVLKDRIWRFGWQLDLLNSKAVRRQLLAYPYSSFRGDIS